MQSNAIMLRNAAGSSLIQGPLRFLNAEQASDSEKMNDATSERPWQLWIKEVESSPLYRNEALKTDASEDV